VINPAHGREPAKVEVRGTVAEYAHPDAVKFAFNSDFELEGELFWGGGEILRDSHFI
jgi:hypothetical protein